MNRKAQENVVFRGMGWMIGTVSILFLMSAGLELFVRQAFRQADITTVLLALALAAWSSVLGIVGLVLLSFWWVVRQVREPINKATLNRYAPVEPRSHRLEKPELADSQFRQPDPARSIPKRSLSETTARDEAPSSTRAAEAGAQFSRVNGVLP
jgi:hypothetical protein